MRRLPWLNALLLLLVAALGAFVYLKPSVDSRNENALSKLKVSEANTIRIERPGATAISLEKKSAGWRVTAPLSARADETRVQRLLSIVEAKSAVRMPATELARFELDPPSVSLTIGTQAFSFGMVNSLTREQYVMTGDAVFAVNPRFGAALPATSVEVASKQLFGPDEIPVRIALKDFSLEQRDGKWTLSPAPSDVPSQDDYARWADGWRFASAIRVEPYVGGKPRQDVEVRLKSGVAITLGILASGASLVLTRPDEKLQYYFNIETAKRLLSPPGPRTSQAAKK
jgi:uncharacterized protein DUF4340